MDKRKYNFIVPNDAPMQPLPLDVIKLYQVCNFENPKTHKYELREITVGENNNILAYRTLRVDKKIKKKLLNSLRENKYTLHSTYSLSQIGLPSYNDISLARSNMLNNDNDYTGFAKF